MNKFFSRFITLLLCFAVFASNLTIVSFAASLGKVANVKVSSYSANSVTFTWKKVSSASGYKIYLYSNTNKKWLSEATVKGTSYTDKNLKCGTLYKYRIKAYRVSNKKTSYGGASETLSALTKPKKTEALAGKASSDSVTLSWKKADGASGYIVYMKKSSGDKAQSVLKTTKLTATVKNLESGAAYIFLVRAYTKNSLTSYGAYSDEIKLTTLPEKVGSLKLSASTETSISLSWKKVKNATGYQVYKLGTDGWQKAGTTTAVTFTQKSLKSGVKISYRVRAYLKSGGKTLYSAFSDTIEVCTLPKKVKNLKAATSSSNGIALAWEKSDGADGYEIYRMRENESKWTLIESKCVSRSFVDANLKNSGKYYYKVRAYATAGGKKYYSQFCNQASHTYEIVKEPNNPYTDYGDIANTGVIGYLYDKKGGYFYTASDPWQRNFGYNEVYDAAAPAILIDYDTVRFKFEAENKDWMIQLWKGQYGMVFYGGEIGVYTKPKNRKYEHYDCASDEDSLKMSFEFYEREWNGMKRVWNKKFERPYGTYWWCTGFIPGNSGLSYSDLMMKIRITLKSFEMLDGFTKALDKNRFEYEVKGLDIYFTYK